VVQRVTDGLIEKRPPGVNLSRSWGSVDNRVVGVFTSIYFGVGIRIKVLKNNVFNTRTVR